jgi:predicted RNA binding protein YcfA (HicA-like mRNA interferase family)
MIRRADLERHLRRHGCELKRHGGSHDVWTNPATGKQSTVPRHREMPATTARVICDQLGVARI